MAIVEVRELSDGTFGIRRAYLCDWCGSEALSPANGWQPAPEGRHGCPEHAGTARKEFNSLFRQKGVAWSA